MLETYFFKSASIKDSAILGAFRITRPLSYFFAPLIMGASLLVTTHQYVFIVVGIMCLVAILPVMGMREIR